MPPFKTPFSDYCVRFSPFHEGRLLVAISQNFGILGNGRLRVLDLLAQPLAQVPSPSSPPSTPRTAYTTAADPSRTTPSQSPMAPSSSGTSPCLPLTTPCARSLREHSSEAHAVEWNPVRRDSFLSASRDDSLELWTLDRPDNLRTFREHSYCVCAVSWIPRHGDVFASASGDRTDCPRT